MPDGPDSPLPSPLSPESSEKVVPSRNDATSPAPNSELKRSRKGLQLGLRLSLALLLLGILFHRPILHSALKHLLQNAAKRDGLSLEVKLSGNGLTHLALDSLRIAPITPNPEENGQPQNPSSSGIRSIHIEKAELRYSLPRLLWSGPGECISSYIVSGASFHFRNRPVAPPTTIPSLTAPSLSHASDHETKTRTFAKLLEDILGQPALYADSVQVSNLDLEIEGPSVIRSLKGLELIALPSKSGIFRIASVQLSNGTSFENWTATTNYPQRHLQITNLQIAPDLNLETFAFDASERSAGKSKAEIRLRYKNGHISSTVLALKANSLANPQKVSDLHLKLSVSRFLTEEMAKLLNWHIPVSEVEWAETHLRGDPQKPSTWKGQADIRASSIFQNPDPNSPYCEPLVSELHAAFHSGTFYLDSISAYSGTTTASASGKIHLPDSVHSLEQTDGTVNLQIYSEDISTWGFLVGIPSHTPLSGTSTVSGALRLSKGLMSLHMKGTGTSANSGPIQFSEANFQIESNVPILSSGVSLKDASGDASLAVKTPTLRLPHGGIGLESLNANATIQAGTLQLDKLTLASASNTIEAKAEIPLFHTNPNVYRASTVQVRVECPEIDQLNLSILDHRVTGTLHGNLTGQVLNGSWTGPLALSAKPLAWGGFDLGELNLLATLSENHLEIQDLLLGWTKNERIQVSGSAALTAPCAYQIKADARLSRLERLAPLLRQSGFDSDIGGSFEAQWIGQGTARPASGTGSWQLSIKNAHWKSLLLNEGLCSGTYTPGHMKASPVRISTPHTRLNSQIVWSEDTLRIQEIAMEQWGYPTLSGFLMLPLSWDGNGAHWVDGSRLSGQLNASGLDLVSLFTAAGVPAPVAGSVKFTLSLAGTPLAPEATLSLTARELRRPSTPTLGSAEFDLNGRYHEGNFESSATLRSGLQSPVSLQVKFPAPLKDLLLGKTPPLQTPIQAHLQTTKANLKLLPVLLPEFKKVDGTFSLDMNVGGTLQNPTWKGAFDIDAPITHFVNYRFPAITDLHSHVEFDGRDFRMKSLRADLGGGSLNIDGTAHIGDKKTTTLDFHAVANQILLVRTRDLLLRLNGDLRLRGPWQQATISGTASATKSRLTKDIDLVPVNVLKKSSIPTPKPGIGKPWFTLARAPFSDWKFDVHLLTRPEDPILIRGNRLHGSAFADLHLKGTGAALTIDGDYRTTDIAAYLPFAKIEVSRGHVWYFSDRPFLPQLDFSAEAEVRNHRVRLYLTGTPEAPRITLNSDPPLNEADLLTLLTTGVLPGDASENGQALAGRAAAVLFQEISGKVFNSRTGQDRLSALRRFSLDVGSLNSRTGHQETKLTYQINDNFFMIGELGANGDFGGQIKYLIRFR
ncbi:MAG: translocation/assembly module TamB domain-containing protein [Verrucomicrobiota bacterium]